MSRSDTRTSAWTLSAVITTVALAVAVAVPIPAFPGHRAPEAAATSGDPGIACAPGVQFLGYSDALNKTTFGGFAVAELSGITHDPATGLYYVVADRAGATLTHAFTIEAPITDWTLGTPSVTGSTTLTGPGGSTLTGANFDAEGVVLAKDGSLIVASEGGSAAGQQPEVTRFDLGGAHLSDLSVPARFQIGANNLSFESLAESPNGHSLFTATEGPLAVDGRTADLRSRLRIIRWENRGPNGYVPVEEHFYLTEPGRTTGDVGLAELIALSETDLLVLERGFVAGQGNTIRVFHISLRIAPEVSEVANLAGLDAEAHAAALAAKSLLVDVGDCPPSGATNPPDDPANPLLENFEAMALGPRLADGWRSLILLSDDNLSASQATRMVALAVRESLLVGQDGLEQPAD